MASGNSGFTVSLSMEYFAKIHYFYSQPLIKLLRGFLLASLLMLVGISFHNLQFAKIILFILSTLFMYEIYFHFSIERMMPEKTLATSSEAREVTTLLATQALLPTKTKGIVKRLLKYPQIKFFLQKAQILPNEITFVDIAHDTLLSEALTQAKQARGQYMTTIDILLAYLLLSEETTKLLLQKKLKKEDMVAIAYWTRLHYTQEEKEIKNRVTFWGEGIGEDFVSGWTLETQKYTNNFSLSMSGKAKYIETREKEYEQMVEILSKKEDNNVLLLGEEGVGKESLIEVLAIDSFTGVLPKELNNKKVLELLIGALLAGTQTKGELQARLEGILQEISHAGNIILYIPEFQNVIGASSLNISDVLLPYLRSGKMPIIGTMTTANYKTFMEKNPLREFFGEISISQPDTSQAIRMLLEKALEIEKQYAVSIPYQTITQTIHLAGKYMPDAVLPGNAVILLEDAAHAASNKRAQFVVQEDIIAKVEEKAHIPVGAPTDKEKDLLLHMEDVLHKRVIGQDTAISAVAQAFRRIRSGMSNAERPISFLFLGPTGVGKTETAKAIAESYFGNEGNMIRLDMSEYNDEAGAIKLIGAPGVAERGELTEQVHDHPFSLLLLDEFEKASPQVLNLFLQVLEDGRLTDGSGKTVSFANTIIIATSNAASEVIREQLASSATGIDASFQKMLLEYLQEHAIFKPELLNRFDGIIAFSPLNGNNILQVTNLMLANLSKRLLQEQDITVSFTPQVSQLIVTKAYDIAFGARPMRRFIQDTVEDMLSRALLENKLQRGAKVTVGVATDGAVAFTS